MAEVLNDLDVEDDEKLCHVQLCFLVDCTGSMQVYIDTIKNDIQQTVKRIRDNYPSAQVDCGFVGYRDYGDDPRLEKFDFTSDLEEFKTNVGSVVAKGGQDIPEDVLGGLWVTTEMPWHENTHKVVFHIFDAPPHGYNIYHELPGDDDPEARGETHHLPEIYEIFKARKIDYYMMVQGSDPLTKMMDKFKSDAVAAGYDKLEQRETIEECDRIMDDVAIAVLNTMIVRPSTRCRPPEMIQDEDMHHRRRLPGEETVHPHLRAGQFDVYCGIDFGTDGTGFAFCTPDDPKVRSVNDFGGNCIDVKTRTTLLLGPDKKLLNKPYTFGNEALYQYTHEMEADEAEKHFFLEKFKMALFNDCIDTAKRQGKKDIKKYIVDATGKRIRSFVVLREALRYIIKHVMDRIEAQYGVSDIKKVQWILTVPAIWSQASQAVMRKAAYAAGIPKEHNHDQLLIALEPECAAVIAQKELGLVEGDCYMLIDCGGGTVDIICHKAIGGSDVVEIHVPTGGRWGSSYIDKEFMKWLEHVFGKDMMNEIGNEPGLKEKIEQNFRDSKNCLVGSDESRNINLSCIRRMLKKHHEDDCKNVEDWNPHLRQVEWEGKKERTIRGGAQLKRNGMLVVSRPLWQVWFSCVVDDIVDHIKEILARNQFRNADASDITKMFVVGGFARSPILMDWLRSEFPDKVIRRPRNPILTVVQGAARYGLVPTSILEKVAQKSLGIAVRDEYLEGVDPPEKMQTDRGGWRYVDGVFFPLLRKGQPIPHDMQPIVHRLEGVDRRHKHFVIQLYESEDDEVPRLVPEYPCSRIGPKRFPDSFDPNQDDIVLELDVRQYPTMVVRVYFGSESDKVDITWDEANALIDGDDDDDVDGDEDEHVEEV